MDNRLVKTTHDRLNRFYKEEAVAVHIQRLKGKEREEFVYFIQANTDRQLQGLSRDFCLSTLSAMAIPSNAKQYELVLCESVLDGWICETPNLIYEGFEEYVAQLSFEMTVKNVINFLGHTSEDQVSAILGHIPYICPLIFDVGAHPAYTQCIDLRYLEKIVHTLMVAPILSQIIPPDSYLRKYLGFKESLSIAQHKLSKEFGDRFEWDLSSRKSK